MADTESRHDNGAVAEAIRFAVAQNHEGGVPNLLACMVGALAGTCIHLERENAMLRARAEGRTDG